MTGFREKKRFFCYRMVMMTVLLLSFLPVVAQDDQPTVSPEQLIVLSERIESFQEEAGELLDFIQGAQTAQIVSIHRMADIVSTRWKGFMQQEEGIITLDDSLMVKVSDFEQSLKVLTDSIASREETLRLHAVFVSAEKFLNQQEKDYAQLMKKVTLLSLSPKTEAQLEESKTREQLTFAEIQQNYDNAKSAASRDPKLDKRMENLDAVYIQLKTLSGKIQETVYKTPVERAKDYLLSLACVAVLLMCVNMVVTRIGAIKQANKAAKEMKKMMERQNNDIPTI